MDAASRAADRARLSELEERMQRAEIDSAELGLEREKIQALDRYTYPILTLPNEIVAEIFTQYLPPYPDFPPFVGPGSPTHLLGICRLWRSIALHSPELWRAIKLRCKVHPNWVQMAEAWLQRSGASPLSVDLDFESNSGFTEAEDSLLNAVVAHRSRWEYINIIAPPSQIYLLSGPSPTLQAATNLVRCKLFIDGDLGGLRAAHCHGGLLRLEILVLHCLSNREDDYLAAFTLPSLRKLEISDCQLDLHAIDRLHSFLLRSACRLERLRIMSDSSERNEWIAPCRIAFPDVVIYDCAYDYVSENDVEWKTEEYWDVAPILVVPL
ncbi:hypothetical protein C8F01DRAFT_1224690 [Mycena amicta]|nr:hypothetical protein C8F01DRAFT_1224690 [Mycena amicta]